MILQFSSVDINQEAKEKKSEGVREGRREGGAKRGEEKRTELGMRLCCVVLEKI